MAVYNGERFIREQLDSFVRQTRLPNELVISDNCSTDGTVAIIHEFAKRAPFPVRLFINERNLGVSKNFERAIAECSGDLIFLSDCDDVWYADKLMVMERVLTECVTAGLALCDADVVDEELRPRNRRIWQIGKFTPRSGMRNKLAAGKRFKRSIPTLGNCIAFRAAFKSFLLPFPNGEAFERGGFDIFLAWTIVYSGAGGIAIVPRPLLAYRQHPQQMTGSVSEARVGVVSRLIAERGASPSSPFMEATLQRLEAPVNIDHAVNPAMRSSVIRHWRARCNLPRSHFRRSVVILRELATLRYHRFSSGILTAVKDLVFVK